MKNRQYLTRLIALLGCCAAGPAHAQFAFTRIVDTGTPVPGGSGDFLSFGNNPVLSGGNLAFYGSGGSSQGIYLYSSGMLQKVADSTTSIPNGGGSRFVSFDVPSLSGNNVTFYGSDVSTHFGIYTGGVGGTLQVAANTATSIPGGSGNFTGFGLSTGSSGGKIAFFGRGPSSQRGIYAETGGTLSVVADRNTAVPGGTGNFRLFFTPVVSGANVAFRGTDAALNSGIYAELGGGLQSIADTNTLIPDGSGNTFTDFGGFSPSLCGSNLAFQGIGATNIGIYDNVGGSLHTIADTNTLIPDGGGNTFTEFDDPSLSGNYVAFDGFDLTGGPSGVYTDLAGNLAKVIAPGDVLDGKTVLSAGGAQIDGSRIGFDVQFGDGSEGIYVASSVPEPGAYAVLGSLGLAGAAFLRRARYTIGR